MATFINVLIDRVRHRVLLLEGPQSFHQSERKYASSIIRSSVVFRRTHGGRLITVRPPLGDINLTDGILICQLLSDIRLSDVCGNGKKIVYFSG
jgi:hypothetical protein